MNTPEDLTKLPKGGTFTLKHDTRVDGDDLKRFIDGGGAIAAEGYKLFIDGPTPIGGDLTVVEQTPLGRDMTIFGPTLTVAPGTEITGAHADGNGGSGVAVLLNGGRGGVQIVPSTSRGRTILKPGDLVYRVIELDLPDLRELHTWKVACVVVERASDRQIRLKTQFSGLSRTLFDPNAYGRLFFETPLQAIRFFLTERRLEIESLDRRRKEAERALAWATSQEGVT